MSAYRTSCGNDLHRSAIHLALTSGEVDALLRGRYQESVAYHHFHANVAVDAIHEDVAERFMSIVPLVYRRDGAYNSSRQRMGAPIASQRDSKRQMVEKDFSPPESVLVWRPWPPVLEMSGST